MKVQVFFTQPNGTETISEYKSAHVQVLDEVAVANLKEAVWFEHGDVVIDGIVEVPEV